MGYRAYQQLREDLWDYKYKAVLGEADNVLSFSQPDAKDDGPTALDLVQQAAERLLLAGKQKDAAERARGEIIDVLNGKLQDVTKALKQAQLRITAAEDYVPPPSNFVRKRPNFSFPKPIGNLRPSNKPSAPGFS